MRRVYVTYLSLICHAVVTSIRKAADLTSGAPRNCFVFIELGLDFRFQDVGGLLLLCLLLVFIEQARNHMHVVLCFSPIGDSFRIRCRKFPALVRSLLL